MIQATLEVQKLARAASDKGAKPVLIAWSESKGIVIVDDTAVPFVRSAGNGALRFAAIYHGGDRCIVAINDDITAAIMWRIGSSLPPEKVGLPDFEDEAEYDEDEEEPEMPGVAALSATEDLRHFAIALRTGPKKEGSRHRPVRVIVICSRPSGEGQPWVGRVIDLQEMNGAEYLAPLLGWSRTSSNGLTLRCTRRFIFDPSDKATITIVDETPVPLSSDSGEDLSSSSTGNKKPRGPKNMEA